MTSVRFQWQRHRFLILLISTSACCSTAYQGVGVPRLASPPPSHNHLCPATRLKKPTSKKMRARLRKIRISPGDQVENHVVSFESACLQSDNRAKKSPQPLSPPEHPPIHGRIAEPNTRRSYTHTDKRETYPSPTTTHFIACMSTVTDWAELAVFS